MGEGKKGKKETLDARKVLKKKKLSDMIAKEEKEKVSHWLVTGVSAEAAASSERCVTGRAGVV